MTNTFVVEKRALTRTHWIRTEPGPLAEGEVRMAIDAFALTSNNITYAAFGETMNYWSFFPTGDTATGCIPVWGFANVVESRCAGLAVGERFYGYLPMASEVVLQPVRVNDTGFSDGAEHRRELHAVYNQYVRCSTDPGHAPAREAEQALLRPLFTTSFLIDDFLADNAYFGAHTLVLSSASSKTAYGTAFCLARRHRDAAGGGAPAVRVVGLTSPGNIAFTQGLGCYDAVLTYDEVTRLSTESPSVYVDFSGSVEVRANVHRHLGHRLAYSGSVGGTHWAALGGGKGLPGPRPVLFFAPAQIKKRNADWTPAVLQQRIAEAWTAFLQPVTDPQHPWLRVVRGRGAAAVEATYAALLAGTVDPSQGHVLAV
ncbi:MAG: DUF2855 family protein [Burkholderiales bacterium]|nr:DUF2855 family protein [Burkholderiales bacterium]